MLRRKQKGQGLTEFALVLPLLLLLLLGVIEASRIIWSYITVQAAAREGARYAITGRPNVTSATGDSCTPPNRFEPPANDINGEPWLCPSDERVKAIKAVVRNRGRTLAVSQFCDGSSTDFQDCKGEKGAFGILVTGQKVDNSQPLTPTVIPELDYPGDQGLNVMVSTYYNVEMIDPIFNALMGGNFIPVQGAVQMQNEGLDQSLGFPPPPLDENEIDDLLNIPGGGTGPAIVSLSGALVEQNSDLEVRLLRHSNNFQYDVYLRNIVTGTPYPICPAPVDPTDANGQGDYDCRIHAGIPVGSYALFSTKTGLGSNAALAVYGSNSANFDEATPIEIIAGTTPRVEVAGGDIWAAGSPVTVNLLNHEQDDGDANGNFDLYFEPVGGSPVQIASNLAYDGALSPWVVPDVGNACLQGSATPCRLFSLPAGAPVTNAPYAGGEIFINNPSITLSQGINEFPRGALMIAFLQGHTPNHDYDIWLETETGSAVANLTSVRAVRTDGIGQYSALERFIQGDWANGNYKLVSYEAGGRTYPIAETDIVIDTPADDYITVDGGYTWPITSFINIRLHQHSANTDHYLEFDANTANASRIPILGSAADTFSTDGTGGAVVGYTIPADTVSGTERDVLLASYLTSNGVEQATKTITVVPRPIIEVVEGDTVLPNSTITIKLRNHSPNSSYTIYFGDYARGVGKRLLTMITDGLGEATQTYELSRLPANPPPDFSRPDTCNCYGKFYDLYSQALDGKQIARTPLAIEAADLAVTRIEFPENAQVGATVPVTFTIQNLKPVTINRYFDIDLYLNPSPLVPSYAEGQFNFPGDVKYWRDFVAPNGQPGDTFTIRHDDFFLTDYGDQEFYGYADTTNLVLFEDSEANNIGHDTLPLVCETVEVSSGFDWQEKIYNEQTSSNPVGTGGNANISSLRLTSDGTSTAGDDDDAPDNGHFLLHLEEPITTTAGVDVMVKVEDVGHIPGEDLSKGGLQLRNAINDPRSMKIEYNLAWDDRRQKHRLQVSLRNAPGASVIQWLNSRAVDLARGPVWLRIEREAGSSTFNFYYRQQDAKPTNWGVPYGTAGVAMADQLYVGLFNASYVDDQQTTSDFANFSYTRPDCPPAPEPADGVIPPGLTVCTDLLEQPSFEAQQGWVYDPRDKVFRSSSISLAHTGRYRLVASTYDSGYSNPLFFQQFTMPSWVISDTTGFNLTLYRNIHPLDDGNNPEDRFYAVVATGSDIATSITTPTLVAQGDKPTPSGWEYANLGFIIKDGVNLEDYADQDLYIHFYNNSNANCEDSTKGGPSCYQTQYDFDDVQLTSCTTEPPPTSFTTLLRGVVTLHRSGGSSEKLAGVKVWAYTEGGNELYETFTAQDGSYAFYDLPAGEYIVYSEYNVVDAADPTQIETLATNTVANLRGGAPLVVNLDLFTVSR